MVGLITRAASPAEWAERVLPGFFDDDLHEPPVGPRRWLTLDDLLADDAALLRSTHARLVGNGATPQAGAHYLVGWYAGLVAATAGFALASARAGLIVRAADIRFEVVEDEGWPERLVLDRFEVVVPTGHAWSGGTGDIAVRTAEHAQEVVAETVAALVDVVGPLVRASKQLARTPLASLWDEVGDGLGQSVAHQQRFAVTEEMVVLLTEAVATPTAPWSRRPQLDWARSPTLGPVHVVQRGGCCLSFTERPAEPEEPGSGAAEPEGAEAEPAHPFHADLALYRERFPEVAGAKQYCSTCRFREADDVVARQVFWAERRALRGTGDRELSNAASAP